MSATTATRQGAALAEARMLDTFSVRTPTGRTYNAVTGVEEDGYTELLVTRGRVKVPGGLGVAEAQTGGRTAVTVAWELHVPTSTPLIPPGAVAVCTAVHPSTDPTLLGAVLHLAGPIPGSQTTARRLHVTEVVA